MEELKVNEYVRTKEGYIARVKEIDNKAQAYWFDNCILKISGICCYDLHFEATNYIAKHSFDIKELVQAGDLIKIPEGIYEVIFDESYEKLGILVPNKTCLSIKHSALEYIFSEYKNVEILTKQQFNQMKYIVGDDNDEI